MRARKNNVFGRSKKISDVPTFVTDFAMHLMIVTVGLTVTFVVFDQERMVFAV